nr:Ref family recombination enhancement nuclease [Stenotrophomonas geniculata]
MKRGRSTSKPTVEQQQRMDAIKDIGCVVAYALGMGYIPCEVHHLTVGGKHGQKRRGHDFTIGLNPWSHRGEPFGGMDEETCEALFGPSYAKQPRRFRQEIGNDDYLLDLQNTALDQYWGRVRPWRAA